MKATWVLAGVCAALAIAVAGEGVTLWQQHEQIGVLSARAPVPGPPGPAGPVGPGGPAGPSGPPGSTVELPTAVSPIDEDAALYSAAQALLGHNPTTAQLVDFRSYYDALEANTSVQPPSLASAAEAFLRTYASAEVQQQTTAEKYQQLLGMLSGENVPNFGQEGH